MSSKNYSSCSSYDKSDILSVCTRINWRSRLLKNWVRDAQTYRGTVLRSQAGRSRSRWRRRWLLPRARSVAARRLPRPPRWSQSWVLGWAPANHGDDPPRVTPSARPTVRQPSPAKHVARVSGIVDVYIMQYPRKVIFWCECSKMLMNANLTPASSAARKVTRAAASLMWAFLMPRASVGFFMSFITDTGAATIFTFSAGIYHHGIVLINLKYYCIIPAIS